MFLATAPATCASRRETEERKMRYRFAFTGMTNPGEFSLTVESLRTLQEIKDIGGNITPSTGEGDLSFEGNFSAKYADMLVAALKRAFSLKATFTPLVILEVKDTGSNPVSPDDLILIDRVAGRVGGVFQELTFKVQPRFRSASDTDAYECLVTITGAGVRESEMQQVFNRAARHTGLGREFVAK
jgi:hypothetical protein